MSDGRNLALDGVRGLAALSVALGHPPLLEKASIKFLGAVSYPFYLVHPLGMAGALNFIGPPPGMNFLFQFDVYALVSLLISLPVAWLLHVTVEMPALKGRPRMGRKPALS